MRALVALLVVAAWAAGCGDDTSANDLAVDAATSDLRFVAVGCAGFQECMDTCLAGDVGNMRGLHAVVQRRRETRRERSLRGRDRVRRGPLPW